MNVALRDIIIDRLQTEIKKNQKEVFSQLREIEDVQGENIFLADVYADYKRYKDFILREKERETEQMEMLVKYLDNIFEEINLTEDMRRRALFEQNRILEQLDNVKKDLDNLVLN